MNLTEVLIEKSFCINEYGLLKRVIVCEPKHMTIRDIINDTQKHFQNEGIHIQKAMEQHAQFVQILKANGIDVILLPPAKKFPEQVFTRDIGFTLGQTIFVSDMAVPIRNGEEEILKNWLKGEELSYFNIIGDSIEGGDIIIDGNTIYVGISDRTNEAAFNHLKSLLPTFTVTSVRFHPQYLHLDCVFNVISPTEAIIFPGVIDKQDEELLRSKYDLIYVSPEEQFSLATNVLSIGNKKIFSLPVNKGVNGDLRKRGYDVIEVDITEIIKSGGSFRCCTLPILRE
ncbi:dimethylarginine dimethylaminohydrolase family protein [Bacillaceae bacterium IKA-2]|nr:dimethylarginine dimethylaminohydrolase family protein [Bacillaceae bacterium IKA-2]